MDGNVMDDLIKEAKELVESSEAAYRDGWRIPGREDLLMLAGEGHWPGTTAAQRETEGRPALVINQLPQFVARITGEYKLNQFAISLVPGDNDADPQTVETLEQMVRAIQHDSLAKVAYRVGLQNAAGCGLGWLRVVREYESPESFDQILRIHPLYNPFSLYLSAPSVRHDLEDCSGLVILEEMEEKAYTAKYGDASAADMAPGTGNQKRSWTNASDKTVTVAEYWRRVPRKTTYALFSNGETAELTKENQERAYLAGLQVLQTKKAEVSDIEMALVSAVEVLEKPSKQPGRYFPFVPIYGEQVFVDGKKRLWGVLRNAKEPQRITNYQWTAAVEAVILQPKVPYIGTEKMFEGYENEWDTANQVTRSRLTYNPDPQAPGQRPAREPPPITPVAALSLVEKSEQMMKSVTGIYESALGQKSNEASGIAIQQRQVATSAATATYPDNLALAMEHLADVIIDLVPYTYDTARRVPGMPADFGPREQIQINGNGGPDVTRGRYKAVATIGPAYQTQRQEAFSGMLEFGKLMGPAFALMADLVAGLSDIPGREAFVERLKQIQATQGFSEDGQPPPQMMDQIMAAVQQMVPQPEQVQALVVQTLQGVLQGGMRPSNAGIAPS